MDGPRPVTQDSRGIIGPEALRRHTRLNRYPAGPALEGLVAWFWVASWQLPPNITHTQELLTHPGANLYVSPEEPNGATRAELEGVLQHRSSRRLSGTGICVAAMTTPGGLGAFLEGPAGRYNDRVVPLGQAIRTDDEALVGRIQAAEDKVAVLRRALEAAVNEQRAQPARAVASVAKLAETDRTLRRVEQLATQAGTSVRTLQRMFAEYAGVSPTWVLRRYRLLDAAESARRGENVKWARIAADLGYSDQAHLIRDFSAAIGSTPAAYARAGS